MGLAATAYGQGRPLMIVYEHADYQGRQSIIDRDVRDFEEIRFNDRVSSIRVQSGTWEVCEHADFRGRCMTVSRDAVNLQADGFNDRISSARLVSGGGGGFGRRDDYDRRGWREDRREERREERRDDRRAGGFGGGGAVIFQHAGFQGSSRFIAGENSNLQSVDMNDELSSIRIERGVWELCEHADYRGRCITVDHDVANMQDVGMNDRVSSLRRIR
jgi:hypothetical protein